MLKTVKISMGEKTENPDLKKFFRIDTRIKAIQEAADSDRFFLAGHAFTRIFEELFNLRIAEDFLEIVSCSANIQIAENGKFWSCQVFFKLGGIQFAIDTWRSRLTISSENYFYDFALSSVTFNLINELFENKLNQNKED